LLAFFLALALDGAAVAAPPAATYRYDAAIDRKPVGGSTLTLTTTPRGLKLAESSISHLPTGDTRTQAMMLLDASLVPTSYTSSYKVQDDTMKATVVFDARTAVVTAGGDPRTFQLGGSSKHFVVLDIATASGFLMLPSQMHAWRDADTTALVPALGSVLFLSILHDVQSQRPAGVPPADVSISFAGEAPFVEWYDPATLVVDEIDVPGQKLQIVRRR